MKKVPLSLAALLLAALFSCTSHPKNATSAVDSATMMADSTKKDTSALADTSARTKKSPVTDITVLYGTDRVVLGSGGNIQYGNQPANPGSKAYSVGFTVVTIPPTHKEGNIETPSIWKLEFHEDTLKHMVQKRIDRLSDGDFDALLKKSKSGQDAFIFVHGFNNTFKDAALRTAQLAQDIHLPVTPIMFSWSSNGKTADYAGDEDKVQLAVPGFSDFIKRIAKKGNYKNIHLIAHSMGNRLISLAMLRLQNDTTNLKIDQIIMAAPDVYADLFKLDYADALIKHSKHITIYSAKNDWALLASRKLHGDLRLGEVGVPPPALVLKNTDIIDAVKEKTDFLGHDRFARSPVIIADMDAILKNGLTASQRKIPSKMYGSYLYYYFK
jgi:esterase/lipase superfamily enzyme